MKRKIALLMAAVLALSVLGGCAASGGTGAATGTQSGSAGVEAAAEASGEGTAAVDQDFYKEVAVGVASDVQDLDPRNGSSTASAVVLNYLYNKLVKTNESMEIVPDLAESWEYIDDKTVEFKLREGVKFHDGSDFTADDVVYTFDSIHDSSFKLYADFSFMEAEKVDDYTVRISTPEPYSSLMLYLNYVHIIPSDYAAEVGPEGFSAAPVGTGPYKFVEWVKDERIVLEKNEDYFMGARNIDKITFRVIAEAASRVAALQAGDVDIISQVSSTDVPMLEADDNLEVVTCKSGRISYLLFNTYNDSPLQDPKVRQAIGYAIDYDTYFEGFLDGYGAKVETLACPEFDGYDPSIKGFSYDPEKAKALLAEAGYPDGFTAKAWYTNQSTGDQFTLLASMLAEVGITLELEATTNDALRDAYSNHSSADVYTMSIGGPYCDIDMMARLLFGTDQRYSNYSDPEWDELRVAASFEVDTEKRHELQSELQQKFIDDAPGIALNQVVYNYAYNKKLQGFVPRADDLVFIYDCDLLK